MIKRLIIALAYFLIAVLAGLAVVRFYPRPAEPSYQGKPASYWIAHLSRPVSLVPVGELKKELPAFHLDPHLSLSDRGSLTKDFEVIPTLAATEEHPSVGALRAMRSQAVPILLKSLESRDPEIAGNAARLLGQLAPINDTVCSALARRVHATESTAHKTYRLIWGALPTLVSRHLQKPLSPQSFVRRRNDQWFDRALGCYEALGQLLGRARLAQRSHREAIVPLVNVVPELCRALGNREDWVTLLTSQMLGGIGTEAKQCVPPLVRELQNKSRDLDVRVAVAEALGRIAPGSREVIESLKSAVQDTNRVVKCAAIVGLGKSGAAGKETRGFLEQIWHGQDRLLSFLAYEALCGVDPELMKSVSSPEPIPPPPGSVPVTTGPVVYRFKVDLAGATDDFSLFIRFQGR